MANKKDTDVPLSTDGYTILLKKAAAAESFFRVAGREARIAHELHAEGYLEFVEVTNKDGDPVYGSVMAITPKGREWLERPKQTWSSFGKNFVASAIGAIATLLVQWLSKKI